MKPWLNHWSLHTTLLIISPFVTIFAVFNVLFSDVISVTDYLQAFTLVFGVYGLLSYASVWVWGVRRRSTLLGWWLIPPVLVILLYMLAEPGVVAYSLGILATAVAGTWTGFKIGSRHQPILR